ncbi:MAG: hypothetical protein LBJ81_01720 [Puniceicoccales bacterium]|jgi:hypothetical protein|nr:hypothetical protein [Puniceicoccales bacterium]
MVKSKLMQLRIRSISLLLGVSFGRAIATDAPQGDADTLRLEARQVVEALKRLQDTSGAVSEEERQLDKDFLHKKDIFPEALYKPEDVARIWTGDLAQFSKNVVQIEKVRCAYNASSRIWLADVFSGTGTLFDVGIPELEGRVVVTCAHVALPEFNQGHNIAQLLIGGEVIPFGQQSIVHFFRHSEACPKSFLLLEENGNAWYDELSVRAECKPGEVSSNIPVTDIYVFAGNEEGTVCYDIAVLILEKPVKYEGEIIPGVELDQLSLVDMTGRIGEEAPRHICLEESPGEALPEDKRPVVIGYGVSGGLSDSMLQFFPEEKARSLLGNGVKKAITLNGLDAVGKDELQNVKGCGCASLYGYRKQELLFKRIELEKKIYEDWMKCANDSYKEIQAALAEGWENIAKIRREIAKGRLGEAKRAKEKIEELVAEYKKGMNEFKEKKSYYSFPRCGEGNSGSFIFRKNDDGYYDALGILSGPLFTSDIVDFIKNAVQYQCENCERGIWGRLKRWFGSFFRR